MSTIEQRTAGPVQKNHSGIKENMALLTAEEGRWYAMQGICPK